MSEGKKKYPNNSRWSDLAPYVRKANREVSVWVDPEERDYWYNLDYLCGTYHNDVRIKRKKEEIMPCHGLGYGEDETSD